MASAKAEHEHRTSRCPRALSGCPSQGEGGHGAAVAVRRIGKAVTTIIIIDRISRPLCPVCQALC